MSCSALFSLQSPSGFFSMSCSGLTRTSMDPRVTLRLPEDDKEEMPEHDAFLSVTLGLDPDIQKTQGTSSRYARRKQRASIKIRAAAGVAVKLATACHVRA